jgi:hypothetical protein
VSETAVPSGGALVADASGGEEEPDGTEKKPFGTVQDALAAVAKAYDDEEGKDWKEKVGKWQDEVKTWTPEKSKSPPNPGKAISAEIVIVGTITSGLISIAEAEGTTTYPPLILRDSPGTPGTPGTLTLNTKGTLITVGAGVNLTLGGSLNLVGISGNNASLVRVETNGNLTLADKAVISGNTNTNDDAEVYGGGVYVAGKFAMSGGVIRGNRVSSGFRNGGGVYVAGTFTMSGGVIGDENYANYLGGGVYVKAGGTFDMSGDGEIWKNTANFNGGGVYVAGTFTMSGGVIGGNQSGKPGGGVGISGPDTDYNDDGSEVRLPGGVFDKTGGIIYGNDDSTDGNNNTNADVGNEFLHGGHAVAVTDYGEGNYGTRRNDTADGEVKLSYNGSKDPPTSSGAWD